MNTLIKCWGKDEHYSFIDIKNKNIKYKYGNRNYNNTDICKDAYEHFWRTWLFEQDNNTLQELVGTWFPLMIDLDIILESKLYTPKEHDVNNFYKILCMHLRKQFKIVNEDDLFCIVQHRNNFTKKGNHYKRGLHLIFPNIIVDIPGAIEFRKRVLQEPCGDLFKLCINTKEDCWDKQIYRPNLTWKMNGNDYYIWLLFTSRGDPTPDDIIRIIKADLQGTFDGVFANDEINHTNYTHYLPLLTAMNRAKYLSLS
jgi:hypothetical protein